MKFFAPVQVVGALLVFCASGAFAASNEHPGLTIADDKVFVAGHPAARGATVAPGATITTGPHSRAELTLPDGSVVRIGQGSSFTFTGSKFVLNAGSALVRAAHKGTVVTTPARTYTGGPGVVTVQASKQYDGMFILQGSGKVNGALLVAGQAAVLENGKNRVFSFDLQKLAGTSALIRKFPRTVWSAQTEALGAIQHQLLTNTIVQAAQRQQGAAGVSGTAGAASTALISARANQLLANNNAIPISTGSGGIALLSKSAGAGSLVLSSYGSGIYTGGGASTIYVNNGGSFSGATLSLGSVAINRASFGNTLAGGQLNVLTVNSGAVGGNVTVNSYTGTLTTGTGVIRLNTGTLNVSTGVTLVTGKPNLVSAGTLISSGAVNKSGTNTITLSGGGISGASGVLQVAH